MNWKMKCWRRKTRLTGPVLGHFWDLESIGINSKDLEYEEKDFLKSYQEDYMK